jgi:hypothetical protein
MKQVSVYIRNFLSADGISLFGKDGGQIQNSDSILKIKINLLLITTTNQ